MPSRRLVAIITVVLLLPGCATDAGVESAPADRCARASGTVRAMPGTSGNFDPVTIRAEQLPAGCTVHLVVSAENEAGVGFTSDSVYTVAQDGTIDTSRDPVGNGAYPGTDATEPLTAVAANGAGSPPGWVGAGETTYTLTVRGDGKGIATGELRRRAMPWDEVQTYDAEPFDSSSTGQLVVPGWNVVAAQAVLLVGGSEGGAPTTEALALARTGRPALAVCYFKCGSGRTGIDRVPIETFAKALDWLRDQPEVDPDRITVIGISRGAEAAQLLGAARPKDIRQLVLVSGNHVARPIYAEYGIDAWRAAWTVAGRDVPFAVPEHRLEELPVDSPAALPSAAFPGPVTVVCGGHDKVLPACYNAETIKKRRDVRGLTTTVLREEAAGHGIANLVPNIAGARSWELNEEYLTGLRPGDNEPARRRIWPEIVALVDR